jgi:hypothetical protein
MNIFFLTSESGILLKKFLSEIIQKCKILLEGLYAKVEN